MSVHIRAADVVRRRRHYDSLLKIRQLDSVSKSDDRRATDEPWALVHNYCLGFPSSDALTSQRLLAATKVMRVTDVCQAMAPFLRSPEKAFRAVEAALSELRDVASRDLVMERAIVEQTRAILLSGFAALDKRCRRIRVAASLRGRLAQPTACSASDLERYDSLEIFLSSPRAS